MMQETSEDFGKSRRSGLWRPDEAGEFDGTQRDTFLNMMDANSTIGQAAIQPHPWWYLRTGRPLTITSGMLLYRSLGSIFGF